MNDTANNFGLVVNLSKPNVVVFRNDGHLALREKWFYNGIRLAVVNQYKYLGVIFSTGLTFSYCLEDMASRAKKGGHRYSEAFVDSSRAVTYIIL